MFPFAPLDVNTNYERAHCFTDQNATATFGRAPTVVRPDYSVDVRVEASGELKHINSKKNGTDTGADERPRFPQDIGGSGSARDFATAWQIRQRFYWVL